MAAIDFWRHDLVEWTDQEVRMHRLLRRLPEVAEYWIQVEQCEPGEAQRRAEALLVPAFFAAARVDSDRPRFRFVDFREVLSQGRAEWLVENMLPSGGSSLLVGESGIGKSTLAIDLACSVATGLPFLGHAVQTGAVAYVVGEGWGGLGQRVQAWLGYHNLDSANLDGGVTFLNDTPNLGNPDDVEDLILALRLTGAGVRLIIIDTLARTSGDLDVDKTRDMSRYVAGTRRLQSATGAHTMVLHHPGWADKSRERNSNVLRGAVDTAILLKREHQARIALTCTKQRDAALFQARILELTPVGDAVLLAPFDKNSGQAPLLLSRQQALAALETVGPCTYVKWLRVSGLTKATFDRCRIDLVSEGLVEQDGKQYRLKVSRNAG